MWGIVRTLYALIAAQHGSNGPWPLCSPAAEWEQPRNHISLVVHDNPRNRASVTFPSTVGLSDNACDSALSKHNLQQVLISACGLLRCYLLTHNCCPVQLRLLGSVLFVAIQWIIVPHVRFRRIPQLRFV